MARRIPKTDPHPLPQVVPTERVGQYSSLGPPSGLSNFQNVWDSEYYQRWMCVSRVRYAGCGDLLFNAWRKALREGVQADVIFGGMGNGLDVILVKDPFGDDSPEDRGTGIEFSAFEWGSFYFDTLGATGTEYIQGEEWLEYETRRRLNFKGSLQEYPLLSRIDDFYQDASFSIDEVEVLREELTRVEDLALDKQGRAFLDGMVKACDLAAEAKMGILLSSS